MKRLAITIYKRQGNSWQRYIFKNAFVTQTDAVKEDGAGMVKSGKLIARIFSNGVDIIEPGDRVVSGIGGRKVPDNTLLVKEVRKNTEVSKQHIRITAV